MSCTDLVELEKLVHVYRKKSQMENKLKKEYNNTFLSLNV
ncbi:hypothetical protein LEP1GSC116_0307, partial [Leptospira interrogans serovar Icterohaemorrhagiae str. Verdun HP]